MFRKKGTIWDTLLPWIIGIVVLVLLVFISAILTGKGGGIIAYIKNLSRFGI